MGMSDKLKILSAYFSKRWTLNRLRTRADISLRQLQLLRKLRVHATQAFPFYRAQNTVDFKDWPIIDKTILLKEFHGMNALGMAREQAWDLAESSLRNGNNSAQFKHHTIGTSTGTSGQRGLFIISSDERIMWLGSILARCVEEFPWVKRRVAVMLATGNDLYQTSSASGRLAFQFIDLKLGLEIHSEGLQKFSPDILIGPPGVIAALAHAKLDLHLKHIFTGGEVLDEIDALPIAQWFGIKPRSIYQATEGFLGVACKYGHIHLNEDDMLFEEEPVVGHPNHFVPIITDLRRRSQAMIRYRLNDILVKLERPCPCGSPLMALARVEGRCDDVLLINGVKIMPDGLRAVILDADRKLTDFRLSQKLDTSLELSFNSDASSATIENVTTALTNYLESRVGKIALKVSIGIPAEPAKKLRRIMCEIR